MNTLSNPMSSMTMTMLMAMAIQPSIPRPRQIRFIPRTRFTHGSLSHRRHNLLLHIITPLLEIDILKIIPPLSLLLPNIPPPDYEYRAWDCDGPIEPETRAYGGGIIVLEIEKGHGEDGCEIRTREEDGTEEGDGFHGAGIAFCSVGELSLFFGHLKIKFGFFLGDDVIELGSLVSD